MSNTSIKDLVTIEETEDNFVGIRIIDGKPRVSFPRGFNISNDEKELRKDIFRLLAVLQKFSRSFSGMEKAKSELGLSRLPLTSYQYIIQDYLTHGYYNEKESYYKESLNGKISWKKTIQTERAYLDDGNIVYLKYKTKKNLSNYKNLITLIHEYCVYESFYRFGWLYLPYEYLPKKPQIKLNKQLFIAVLRKALLNTFNDEKKKLFQCMINIISNVEEKSDNRFLELGVTYFENVWQKLVDYVFGEDNIEKYFPHASWHIIESGETVQSRPLRQDTIMKCEDKLYILDSKYYKYGVTKSKDDLPQSSDVQKQIIYGKRVAKEEIDKNNIYNAFIMPFDGNGEKYKFVSVATTDWEEYNCDTKNYAYVLGILLDTKYIISNYIRHNDSEIEEMAKLIENSLEEYRKDCK